MKKLFKNALQDKRGFTLVELIVVIVIVLILSSVLVPNVSKYIRNAKTAVGKTNAQSILTQLQADLEFANLVGNGFKDWEWDRCVDVIGGVPVYLCRYDAYGLSKENSATWDTMNSKTVQFQSGVYVTKGYPFAVVQLDEKKTKIVVFSYSWKAETHYKWTPADGWSEWPPGTTY